MGWKSRRKDAKGLLGERVELGVQVGMIQFPISMPFSQNTKAHTVETPLHPNAEMYQLGQRYERYLTEQYAALMMNGNWYAAD